ncbi:high choriolytic enzyme 2-like [Xyrichtys novacula]|uniref:Metalloendopeptidase n=1 Tax=Xyrichtys novacula TaxID=13765 RepID=A0AAV1EID9_XYRNO|nr:high choriolytic enzyme 2-like [Xyrichtys novacula]
MSPSASLLLLLLLGLSQALSLQEEGSADNGEEAQVDKDVEEDIDIEEEEVPDSVDITTRILTSNNATDEILLEGDLLAPRTRNAIKCWYQKCLWRKASNGLVMIPFTVSGQFTRRERRMMDYAMKVYHSRTCIRFVPRTNQYDHISIESRAGCFSSLGRQGGRQVLSLNRRGCLYHGIIQHEINHALGFQHEQTRSDRDRYVRINWQNINSQMSYNFYRQSTNNLNTPYDYSSIMHYGRTAFSINGRDSITPIPDPKVQIGQRRGMSYWDIRRINLLYGC